VILGFRVLLKCLLEIAWKSCGNLFGWISRHPAIAVVCTCSELVLQTKLNRTSKFISVQFSRGDVAGPAYSAVQQSDELKQCLSWDVMGLKQCLSWAYAV